MVASTSRLAFSDCFELLDKAVADAKGIQVKFASHKDAYHFRLRIHAARKIDRKDNLELYPEGHPMYGRSPYDSITCRIKGKNGAFWLRMERIDAREFEIESLADEPEPPEEKAEVGIPPVPVVIQVIPRKRIDRRF